MFGTPTTSLPPGARMPAIARRVDTGSGTCSSTCDIRTMSHGPSGRRPSCSAASSDPCTTHAFPASCAARTADSDGSSPQASWPASRRAATAIPVPAPTSSTREPGRSGPPVSASGMAIPITRAARRPAPAARDSARPDARAVTDARRGSCCG